jgi:hypothetical protein
MGFSIYNAGMTETASTGLFISLDNTLRVFVFKAAQAIDMYFETNLYNFSCFRLSESDWDIPEELEAVLMVSHHLNRDSHSLHWQVPHTFQQSMSSESMLVLLCAIASMDALPIFLCLISVQYTCEQQSPKLCSILLPIIFQ